MSEADWQVRLAGRLGALEVDLEFTVARGPVLVLGPNGAGKTSLLRTIAGARTGLSGHVRLRNRTLMDSQAGVDLPPESRGIGYVPQGLGLFPHLTALENVAFGCGDTRAAFDCARAHLEELDVAAQAEQRPNALSGGEAQRVALARALAIDPTGLLLDEPLSALDVGKRRAMRAFLAERLRGLDRPAMVVTHDLRDVLALQGTLVVLDAGRIAQVGTAEQLAASPANPFVAELFEPL